MKPVFVPLILRPPVKTANSPFRGGYLGWVTQVDHVQGPFSSSSFPQKRRLWCLALGNIPYRSGWSLPVQYLENNPRMFDRWQRVELTELTPLTWHPVFHIATVCGWPSHRGGSVGTTSFRVLPICPAASCFVVKPSQKRCPGSHVKSNETCYVHSVPHRTNLFFETGAFKMDVPPRGERHRVLFAQKKKILRVLQYHRARTTGPSERK